MPVKSTVEPVVSVLVFVIVTGNAGNVIVVPVIPMVMLVMSLLVPVISI